MDADKIPQEDLSTPPSDGLDLTDTITGETRLADLLRSYPWLRDKLQSINPAFKMLTTPFARLMIPKVSVAMMSERSGTDLEELITKLGQLIAEHDRAK